MIQFDKFTQKAQEAMQQAQSLAGKNQHQAIYPLHLLLALANEKEGVVRPVLEKCGAQPAAIVQEAERALKDIPKVTGAQPGAYISPSLNDVVDRASEEAERFKDEFVSTEHLLLSMSKQRNDPAGNLLNKLGATHEKILSALVSVRGTQRITDQNPETKYQALERYAVNLTDQAKKGKLDPVIGRDDEIRRVMQVLSRRTKNNPVLIGEPGVGKTAIVEGLAQRIARGDVPDQLRNKKLVALDLGSMVAGTKFRGEFEDRLKAVLKEISEAAGEIICFIDELHTLVGAGGAEGAIDAANMLKPALGWAFRSAPCRSRSISSSGASRNWRSSGRPWCGSPTAPRGTACVPPRASWSGCGPKRRSSKIAGTRKRARFPACSSSRKSRSVCGKRRSGPRASATGRGRPSC